MNSDCKDRSQLCDRDKGKCTPIKCSTNNDCRGGWFCNTETSRCQDKPAVECQTKDDCTNQKECTDGKCVDAPECAKDEDCKDSVKTQCKDGKCIEAPPECAKDEDCKDGTKTQCKDGKCVEPAPECRKDNDCSDVSKPRCKEGKCIADDRPNEGEACDTGNKPCRTGFTCFAEDPNKTEGICRLPCSILNSKCPSDRVCQRTKDNDGVCVPPNNGKKRGEDCSKDPCEKDLYCAKWQGKQVCAIYCTLPGRNCSSGEECYDVRANLYVCVKEREPCGPGRPCANQGETCVNGRCDPPPTCDKIKCKDTEVCENGQCRDKKCPNEKKCAAGEKCDAATGKCLKPNQGDPPCKKCKSDGTCGSPNETCLGGGGLSGGTQDRFCIERCNTGVCSDTKNFKCQKINITVGRTCTTDRNCASAGSGLTCVSGQCTQVGVSLCLPIIGTCRNRCKNVTCNAPAKCIPTLGQCIVPGSKKICDRCQINEECGGSGDLCLSYPNNAGSFCGKDCSSASCPTGFRCFDLQGGGKQCARSTLTCP